MFRSSSPPAGALRGWSCARLGLGGLVRIAGVARFGVSQVAFEDFGGAAAVAGGEQI
jgi:hypothetical protein